MFVLTKPNTMKQLIIIAALALSFASCKQMCPKVYTTFGKEDSRLGSFYSMQDIHIGTDTVIEGRKVQIIKVN